MSAVEVGCFDGLVCYFIADLCMRHYRGAVLAQASSTNGVWGPWPTAAEHMMGIYHGNFAVEG